MSASRPKPRDRKQLADVLKHAAAGDLDWVHRCVLAAGYRTAFVATSRFQVAAFFGIDPGTVQKWTATGCPGRTEAGYDLSAMAQWLRSRDGSKSLTVRDKQARTRRIEAQARLAELAADRAEGAVVSWVVVQRDLTEHAQALRDSLERLPDELPPLLAGRAIDAMRDVIDERIRAALQRFVDATGEASDRNSGKKTSKR